MRDQVAAEAPEITWAEFLDRFRWEQGEHTTLVGPTGVGKTTLMLQIVDRRDYVCMFANKPRDRTMDALVKRGGYVKQTRFKPRLDQPKIVLWPKGRRMMQDQELQAQVFGEAMETIWQQGGWCVGFDEVRWICDTLKLRGYVEAYWQQARSLGISVIAGCQRPAFVPVMMFDQATHLFIWRDNDERNLKVLGGLGALNPKAVREYVAGLRRREVLYLNTRDNTMFRTFVEIDGGR